MNLRPSLLRFWLEFPTPATRLRAATLLTAAAIGLPSALEAQSVTLDTGFNAPLFTAKVQADRTLALSNGQFLVFSGYADPYVGFDRLNGVTTGNLVRFNADGSLDSTFVLDPSLRPQSIAAVAPMASGQYIIATSQVFYDSGTSRIYRLNANGAIDTSFHSGVGTNGLIRDVAVQADGKVLAGGLGVTGYNGTTVTGLLRLNTDGSIDSGFNVTLVDDPNSSIGQIGFGNGITTDTGIQVQSDAKIIIAGGFNTVDGVTEPAVARLNTDGSLDTSFVPSGFSIEYDSSEDDPQAIRSAAIQSDGKIVLAGRFNSSRYDQIQPLVRLNSDGSVDSAFNAPVGYYDAYTVRLQPDGKLLLGDEIAGLIRLNPDGTLDTAFNNNLPVLQDTYAGAESAGGLIEAIGVQPNGQLLIAGGFDLAGSSVVPGVARLNPDGTLDTSLNIGSLQADASPTQLAVRSDGTILAGGYFDTVGGQPRAGLALLNADGSLNAATLPTPFFVDVNDSPSFILQPDGKIFLYGAEPYDANDDPNVTYLRLNADLTVDTTLTADPTIVESGTFTQSTPVLFQPGSGYLLSGGFGDAVTYITAHSQSVSAFTADLLQRLNLQGAADASFVPGIDPSTIVQGGGAGNGANTTVAVGYDAALAVQPDGKILYKYFDVTSKYRLIRLNADGSLDGSFQVGSAVPGTAPSLGFTEPYDIGAGDEQAMVTTATTLGINGLVVQADGRLLVYGDLTQYDGQAVGGLLRLNADGTPDTSFNAGTGPQGAANGSAATISSLQVQSNGQLLIAGNFQTFNGVTLPGIAQLNSDGSVDPTFAAPGIVNQQVSIGSYGEGAASTQLVEEPNGSFLLAGNYETAAGTGSGSFFHLSATVNAEIAQLTAAQVNVTEAAGSVTLTVNRTDGSTGAISVNYATADGTGVAGVDYQAVSGTLTWADGDTTPKTITVPIINRGLTSGSTLFVVNLSSPAGGVTLGGPVQAAVNILDTASTANILSVNLLSPPSGVTVTAGQPVVVRADVEALSGTLSNVQYSAIDAGGNVIVLGGTANGRGAVTWVPAAAGSFTLKVVATDAQGNTQQATEPLVVVAAANGTAIPQTSLLGNLDGITVPMNATVPVVAQAVDSAGNALQNVQFYLDGVPVASAPVTAIRKESIKAADASAGTLYIANIIASKVQQVMTAVGTTASGVSSVSTAATIYGKANAGAPPTATISNLASGASVPTSAGQSVSVSAASGSQPVAKVQLVVDNQSVGTVMAAPYTFSLPSLAAGSHILSIIATDIGALSSVSAPVVVTAQQAGTSTPAFFTGETALSNGVYYLSFSNGNYFGYYSFLSNPAYLYHFDLGFEYVFDAADGKSGVYLYDFASGTFFYTSPSFPFPYVYDFTLNSVLYYYPDPNNAGHYNTDGVRYFYDFNTGAIITK